MATNERIPARAEDEIDVVSFFLMLWRYKVLIIGIATLFGLIAVYLALSATEIFRAETRIVEVRDRDPTGNGLVGQLGGLASLAGIGGAFGMNKSPEAQATLASDRLLAEFVERNKLESLLADSADRATRWFAVKKFKETILSIDQDKNTSVITVGVEWKDPVVAANWANGIVALANELVRSRAIRDSTRNISYLETQVAKTNVLELQGVMYNLIEAETKTLMLANGRPDYAFMVVDPAVAPEVRSSPRRTLLVLTGLVLGGFFGVGVAFGHNLIRRYKTAR